MPMRWPNK